MQRTDGVPRVFDDGADDYDEAPPRWQHRLASVRARLIGLLVAILLPWLGLLLYTQADERKAAIAHVNDDALRLIQIATSNQAAQIEAARQVLTAYPLYTNFGVADVDGNVWCSAVPLRAQVTVADRSYFRAALATRQFAIGDYLIGRI